MRFDEILTNDDVLDGLWDMHFDECTPIQEATIPAVIDGKDVMACAQTGTGTTNAGLSYETFAVAASVIGGISTMGGTGILSGVLVGASVWAVMDNGLQLIGTQVGLKNVIVGLIVIVCVLLDVIRRTGSFKKKPA